MERALDVHWGPVIERLSSQGTVISLDYSGLAIRWMMTVISLGRNSLVRGWVGRRQPLAKAQCGSNASTSCSAESRWNMATNSRQTWPYHRNYLILNRIEPQFSWRVAANQETLTYLCAAGCAPATGSPQQARWDSTPPVDDWSATFSPARKAGKSPGSGR
jgi:hypothetical protein